MISPPWLPVPPPRYGGIERVVDTLARAFAIAGHEVELFAPRDSTCPLPNRSSLYRARGSIGGLYDQSEYARIGYDKLHHCDIISDHTLGAQHLKEDSPPVVVTMHGPPIGVFRRRYEDISAVASLVAISTSQRREVGSIRVGATIPHGIHLQEYPLKTNTGEYFLFLGRFHPEKSPHIAVEVARKVGAKLVLAGKVEGPEENSYFNMHIRPLLNERIIFIGEIGGAERIEMLQDARALLAPYWKFEPFGLTILEAIACGTPVIAFPFGSSLDVIQNGINGFVCSDASEMAQRLYQVEEIIPSACRRSIASTHDAAQMAWRYEKMFNEVIYSGRLAEVRSGST
jgi:glycosyltransferase involved in cell wall biosynthesis